MTDDIGQRIEAVIRARPGVPATHPLSVSGRSVRLSRERALRTDLKAERGSPVEVEPVLGHVLEHNPAPAFISDKAIDAPALTRGRKSSLYLRYSALHIIQNMASGDRQAAQTIRCIDPVIALNKPDLSIELSKSLDIGIEIETAQSSQTAKSRTTCL